MVHQIKDRVLQIEDGFLSWTFAKTPLISERFNEFSEKREYKVRMKDIVYEIGAIIESQTNTATVVCEKRMGFTPKTDSEGQVNWFSVRDMTANSSLYINNPDTRKKTTMELVEQKVSKKSSKYLPIKKGDVLVSFKLTVGVTKIYNSDLPAYCNEAIDILTPKEDIIRSKYLAYNAKFEYPKHGERTNNGITLNDDHKKEIKIRLPQPTEHYSSLELQDILIEFMDWFYDWFNNACNAIDELKVKLPNITAVFIKKVFLGMKNSES